MPITIKIKNKTNWVVTIILGLGLLLLTFIILIIISLTSLQEQSFFFILYYISFTAPFAAFFILFLYIWLWNTFGKTILIIEPEQITVRYKNKLFASPKIYVKKEIDQIQIKDFQIKKYKFGVRYHFSLSGSTYSVVFIQNRNEIRVIDWITNTKAYEITDEIKKMWY
ncbi:hypothetical protein [Chryseobacterium candidae]|uniref:Bacterial Pleckstrin homology domain-containing protein n=1 Tax=Chryseobacterium candidae TaxID=1978493 RepID=A0ABY2R723_9FLAO|nr:hypothetical protein [Chryseobacterium candidae]THV57451.1 hypothetical protein EK417_15605 [Chryseobacterium candidae]